MTTQTVSQPQLLLQVVVPRKKVKMSPDGDAHGGDDEDNDKVPSQIMQKVTAKWLAQAQDEHASVASFARHALELLKFGAPAQLVNGAMSAGQDEVRHAQSCFELASRFSQQQKHNKAKAEKMTEKKKKKNKTANGGSKEEEKKTDLATPVYFSPGPLNIDRARRLAKTLPEMAVELMQDGCVGETEAVLIAARQLLTATDPHVRKTLQAIVQEEAKHAELAWKTLAWSISQKEQGGKVLQAVLPVFEKELSKRTKTTTVIRSGAIDSKQVRTLQRYGVVNESAILEVNKISAVLVKGLMDDVQTMFEEKKTTIIKSKVNGNEQEKQKNAPSTAHWTTFNPLKRVEAAIKQVSSLG
eukprot:jgi/Bigna1/125492/aug1.1_g200